MKLRYLILLFLSPLLFGQAQQLPDAYDAAMDLIIGGSAGVIHYPEPFSVVSGDSVVACLYSDRLGGGPSGTYPVTDSLGNIYTLSPVAITPGANNPTNVYMMYSKITVGGNDILSVPAFTNYGSLQAARFHNLSGVVNASNTNAVSPPAAVSTISTSVTTTKNSTLLVNCTGAGGFSDRKIIPANNEYLVTQDQQGQATMTQARTKTKGVKSQSSVIWGGAATFGMVTLAMETTPAIYIADTKLPDGGSTSNYSYFLNGTGGVNTLSYACTGLPANGLSLNASTGEISGTAPLTVGTISIACTVTDGTSTSAVDNLTIKIGSALNTITLVGSPIQAEYDVSTTVNVPSVACGQFVLAIITDNDTHQRNGFLPVENGANNYIRDSYGSNVIRISPHGGAFSSALDAYLIGPILTAGTDVITKVNNQNSSSGNEVIIFKVAGTQSFVDTNGSQNGNIFLLTGGGTVSSSMSTLVPNQMAFTTAMNAGFGGGFSTYTIAAPFTTQSIHFDGELLVANDTVSSPGSVTGAVSFTSPNAIDGLGIMMFALRPGLTENACITNKLHVESQVY